MPLDLDFCYAAVIETNSCYWTALYPVLASLPKMTIVIGNANAG